MNHKLAEAIKYWHHIDPVVRNPKNERDYNKLISYLDSLLGLVKGKENHPLSGLILTISNFIALYEEKHYPAPKIKDNDKLDALDVIKDTWHKMTFGKAIRSLRSRDDISQIELAKRLNVSNQFLNDVEYNRKEVWIEFAKKIADIFKYPLEPLLELLIRDQLRKKKLNYIVELKDLPSKPNKKLKQAMKKFLKKKHG